MFIYPSSIGNIGSANSPRILRSKTLGEALFGNGESGFLFNNFSDLKKLYTSPLGTNPVSLDGDTVGLALDDSRWNGVSFPEILNSSLNLISSGVWLLSTTGGTASATEPQPGVLVLQGDNNNFSANADQPFPTVIGNTYVVTATAQSSGTTPSLYVGTTQGGNNLLSTTVPAGTTANRFFVATSTTSWIRFQRTATSSVQIGNIFVRYLVGNHLVQSTATQRPAWKIGPQPYILPDATDDVLLSSFIPTEQLTLSVAAFFPTPSAIRVVMGGGASGTARRAHIAITASGTGSYGWGSYAANTIAGSPNITNTNAVLTFSGDATSVRFWVNGILIETRTGASSPNGTGGGIGLGAFNNNGALTNLFNGRIYSALALNRVATEEEISRINSEFRSNFNA